MVRRTIMTGACALTVAALAACGADREDEVAPPAMEEPATAPMTTETPTTNQGMAPPTAGDTNERGVPGSALDTAATPGVTGDAAITDENESTTTGTSSY